MSVRVVSHVENESFEMLLFYFFLIDYCLKSSKQYFSYIHDNCIPLAAIFVGGMGRNEETLGELTSLQKLNR
jgi:hypothetical protein